MGLAKIIKDNYMKNNFDIVYRDNIELYIKHSKMRSSDFMIKVLNLVKDHNRSRVFYREPYKVVGVNYVLRAKKINNILPEVDNEQGVEIKLKNGLRYELNFGDSSSGLTEDGEFFCIDFSSENLDINWTQSSNKKININHMIDMKFIKENVESIKVYHTSYEDEDCDIIYDAKFSLVSLNIVYLNKFNNLEKFDVFSIATTERFVFGVT